METIYLVCFIVGLVLSVLSFAGGFTHLHLGRMHVGHTAQAHAHGGTHGLSSINGFTITAFLCWFGGAGYLLDRYSIFITPLILLLSVLSGLFGATLLWAILFKLLLPRERVLTTEETEMPGVIARVSDSIRDNGGIGEIIFSQTGARRSTAARSEDGSPIQRGAEVVVIRYERGIAYVRRFDELSDRRFDELSDRRFDEINDSAT
ncbi:MAG TPA: NfeD family protein [Edaphobacter sp.]|jgi:membrane-bound ClpP family serine protease|nr:NfeD family protein [Edaphobacter sp.]